MAMWWSVSLRRHRRRPSSRRSRSCWVSKRIFTTETQRHRDTEKTQAIFPRCLHGKRPYGCHKRETRRKTKELCFLCVSVVSSPPRISRYTGACEFPAKDVLHRDLRLPDELPRLRKGCGNAHLRRLHASAARRGRRPYRVQHLLEPRQGRAEGLPPPGRFQEAAQGREALRRSGLRRPAGGREDL